MYEEEEEDYGYGYPGHMRQASLELNVTEAALPRGNNGELHGGEGKEGGVVEGKEGRGACVTAATTHTLPAVDQPKAKALPCASHLHEALLIPNTKYCTSSSCVAVAVHCKHCQVLCICDGMHMF